MWVNELGVGKGKMLRVATNHYPDWITRQQLAEESEYDVTGGTFSTYLSTLRKMELLEVNKEMVRAHPALFGDESR